MKGSDVVARRIGGETILVPVRAHVAELDSVYTLNEVGSLIWDRLDGHTKPDQIAEAVCKAYNVRPDEATRDLREFLRSLEAEGLIRPSSESET